MKLINGYDIRDDNSRVCEVFALFIMDCEICQQTRLSLNVDTSSGEYRSRTICLSCINQARYLYTDKKKT